jgi:RNA polymerase sigma-70 factor (ECF subfamily)
MSRTPLSLLEKLQGPGDAAAWERFVQLYTPLLSHWVRRLGIHESETADCMQDVFTLLVQKLPDFRYNPALRFRGWLWTVTRNCCHERRRRDAPAPAGGVEELAMPGDGNVADAVAEAEYRQYLT